MAMLTMEEAAKKSGMDPREIRRRLRNGSLKGAKKEGSWTVDSNSLANVGKDKAKGGAKAAAKPAAKKSAKKSAKSAKAKGTESSGDEWGEDEGDE